MPLDSTAWWWPDSPNTVTKDYRYDLVTTSMSSFLSSVVNEISVWGLSAEMLDEWKFESEAAIGALYYKAAEEFSMPPTQFTFFANIDEEQIPLEGDVWSLRAQVNMRDVLGSAKAQAVMVKHAPTTPVEL